MHKLVFSILLLSLTLSGVHAQQPFTKAFKSVGAKRVEVYLTDANVVIKGISGNEIKLNASGKKPLPERAKGLRPISRTAMDNTGLGLEVKESNNIITIKQTASNLLDINLEIPKEAKLLVENSSRKNTPLKIEAMQGEMEISVNRSPVSIKKAVGPIVANSTRGEIEIQFERLSQAGPSSINTVNGFIDITLPSNSKANIELTTLSNNNDIFTDFDIKLLEEEEVKEGRRNKKHKKDWDCKCGEKTIKGTINNGGVEVYLKSVRENIYLRKS